LRERERERVSIEPARAFDLRDARSRRRARAHSRASWRKAVSQPSLESCARVLAELGQRLCAGGRLPATSGNLSLRLDEKSCAITASGTDKGRLGPTDVLGVELCGRPLGTRRPSAETALHTMLYRRSPDVGAVLHTHTRSAVVLSRLAAQSDVLELRGYELLKALRGVSEPDEAIFVPIFANDQNIARLAARVEDYLDRHPERLTWGYLIRSHGLYAWGADAAEAERHLEALEYLVSCELELRGYGGRPRREQEEDHESAARVRGG
jgi:methylthioribulose-1-phosphate dehydratase